jgi:hypothetical protein
MPELEPIITNPEDNQEEQDPIAIITEMRANTVPKDKYNKLVEDNAKLMRALANGETIKVEETPKPNIEELRKEYFDFENKSDVQVAKDILALREAVIESGDQDPFLPNGRGAVITDQDRNDAQAVADLLQYAIDQSGGDNAVFLAQFSSKLVDTGFPGQKRRGR